MKSEATRVDPELAARSLENTPRRVPRIDRGPVSLVWEGTQFRHHSLAVVNREICSRLVARGHDLSAKLFEDHQFDSSAMPRFRALEQRFDRPSERPASIRVRHQWPPSFEPAPESKLVMIQPWEFGHVPVEWIEKMSTQVDEVWVPSRYNRQCYIDSGLLPARVQVIPNGVDLDRFHPDVTPMRLDTKKKTRFLFVGGTIPRKGINQLLGAFCAAFKRDDDVCLIIKDVGVKGVYEGSTAGQVIREMQNRPNSPEILYLDRDMPQDELVSLYRAADVLVHPYLGEGFGMPIVEAMACGLPVMVTGLGACLDFCNRDNAFLIPARRRDLPTRAISGLPLTDNPWLASPDVNEFVAALERAAYAPRLRQEMGRRGRLLVEEEFSWETVVDMVEARLHALQDMNRSEISLDSELGLEDDADEASLDELKQLENAFRPAVKALEDQDYLAAIAAFEGLTNSFPDLAAAHAGLGRSLLFARRFEEALVCLDRALEILPDDETSRLDRATALFFLKRGEEAEADLDLLLGRNVCVAEASILLSRRRRHQGRIDEAAELISRALDLEPDNPQALSDFALLARDLGYRQGFDRALARLGRVAPELKQPSWQD